MAVAVSLLRHRWGRGRLAAAIHETVADGFAAIALERRADRLAGLGLREPVAQGARDERALSASREDLLLVRQDRLLVGEDLVELALVRLDLALVGEDSPAPRFLWTPRSNPFSWFQEVFR